MMDQPLSPHQQLQQLQQHRDRDRDRDQYQQQRLIKPIVRVRTGCLKCRGRKKKCDERRPVCTGCRRNKFECSWSTDAPVSGGNKARPGNQEGSRKKRRWRGKGQDAAGAQTSGRRVPVRRSSMGSDSSAAASSAMHAPPSGRREEDSNSTWRTGRRRLNALSDRSPSISPAAAGSQPGTLSNLDRVQFYVEQGPPVMDDLGSGSGVVPAVSSMAVAIDSSSAAQELGPQNPFSPYISYTRQSDDSTSNGSFPGCTTQDHYNFAPIQGNTLQEESFGNLEATAPDQDQEDFESITRGDYHGLSQSGRGGITDLDQAVSIPMPSEEEPVNTDSPILASSLRFGSPLVDDGSHLLLEHYLHKTAESMSNGFAPANPFLTQLIPVAFMSDLVLKFLVAQSAAHRAQQTLTPDTSARLHYLQSIGKLQQSINRFLSNRGSNPFYLAVGALIMCFTETAQGDVDGATFGHLNGATALLPLALRSGQHTVPAGLKNFIIEYYAYTASLSMISIDVDTDVQTLSNSVVMDDAQDLVACGYTGNLCGCSLGLLLFIPQIFELGQRCRNGDAAEAVPSAMYLQQAILRWAPTEPAYSHGAIAGRVLQQAILVYLFTSSGQTDHRAPSRHQSLLVEDALTTALSSLEQLPMEAQMNTTLCWPLAVIGSCLRDAEQQQLIRSRLGIMYHRIGLGNMRQTLRVLELVWAGDVEDSGPWNLSRTMKRHRIWISFA